MIFSKIWAKVALLFLLIAMVFGVYLRMSFFYNPMTINYKYLLHTHSHIILLGWVFNAIACLLYFQYKSLLDARKLKVMFWLFQISILGMMLTFPFQGYGLYSIIFSTMHILVSYFFVAHFLLQTKKNISLATKFVNAGLFFYLMSTLGPFSLGPIIVNGLKQTPLYDLAIYFYLHFLYNGFMTLTILGLFFKSIENVNFSMKNAKKIYSFLVYTVVPGFVLSIFCYFTNSWLYAVGILTGVAQLIGIYYLYSFLNTNKSQLLKLFNGQITFLLIGLLSFVLKNLLQILSAIPYTTQWLCNSHSVIIAYLHLVFIGFITFSLLGLLFQSKLLDNPENHHKSGFYLLLFGFFFSEVFIASSGFPSIYNLISPALIPILTFSFSTLMLFGVLHFIFNQKSKCTL